MQKRKPITISEAHKRLKGRFTLYNDNNAIEVIESNHPNELKIILKVLKNFSLCIDHIIQNGGAESIPTKILKAALVKCGSIPEFNIQRFGMVTNYKIDHMLSGLPIEVMWNTKDGLYARNLAVFRTLYERNFIKAGVIITRDDSVKEAYKCVYRERAIGASTTQISKLGPMLEDGIHGECPILSVGVGIRCFEEFDK